MCVTSCTTGQNTEIYFMAVTSLHIFTTVTERSSWLTMWQSRCMCVCVMQIICSTYNICSAWSRFSELLPIYIPAWWFQSVHFDKSYNNLHKDRPTHRTTESRKPSDRGWPVVQQNENRWARQLEKNRQARRNGGLKHKLSYTTKCGWNELKIGKWKWDWIEVFILNIYHIAILLFNTNQVNKNDWRKWLLTVYNIAVKTT